MHRRLMKMMSGSDESNGSSVDFSLGHKDDDLTGSRTIGGSSADEVEDADFILGSGKLDQDQDDDVDDSEEGDSENNEDNDLLEGNTDEDSSYDSENDEDENNIQTLTKEDTHLEIEKGRAVQHQLRKLLLIFGFFRF